MRESDTWMRDDWLKVMRESDTILENSVTVRITLLLW